MKNNLYSLLCLLLTSVYTSSGIARSEDSQLPLNIEADRVILNEKNGFSQYLGNVRITQGSRVISGDSIQIHSDKTKVTKIVINGKPALFSQKNDTNEETRASSQRMTFLADKDLLVLEQSAELIQKDNVFRSERITYDTAKDIISAGVDKNADDQRVKITIHPDKSEPSQSPSSPPVITPVEGNQIK